MICRQGHNIKFVTSALSQFQRQSTKILKERLIVPELLPRQRPRQEDTTRLGYLADQQDLITNSANYIIRVCCLCRKEGLPELPSTTTFLRNKILIRFLAHFFENMLHYIFPGLRFAQPWKYLRMAAPISLSTVGLNFSVCRK